MPYCFSRSSVKFQGHTALKIVEFDPNWAFPDSSSSLNTPTATKLCSKLEVVLKWCPIVFQGHPSNFKVTRLKNSSNLTQIGRFRTVTPFLSHQWLRNDAKSLKLHLTHLGLVSHICVMKNSPHFPSDAYMRRKSLYFSYRSRGRPTKQCQAKMS